MNVKAVSFDADGTLLGTFTDRPNGFAEFFLEAARRRGKHFTLEWLLPVLARVREDEARLRDQGFKPYISQENARKHWHWFYREIFNEMGIADASEMAEEFITRYEHCEFTNLYADTIPCLEILRERKIPILLISNFSSLLEGFLDKLEITAYFQAILISGNEGIEKPDKAIFSKGAQMLSLEPREILHVGNDLQEDYHGAIAACMQALLLDRENDCKEKKIRKIRTLLDLPDSLPNLS